jgi:predicted alpha/beta hydrolase family esterase
MKRAFIIHGYQGYPQEAWQPWLRSELESNGYLVALPAMPHPESPGVVEWVDFIDRLIGAPDQDTVLIAHSMGGFAALLYLDRLDGAKKSVGKTVLIATGFPSGLSAREADERADGDPVLRSWLGCTVDSGRVRRAAGKCTVILSDDDPYIPVDEARAAFAANLEARIIIEKGLGHMNEDSRITRLPSALTAVLS